MPRTPPALLLSVVAPFRNCEASAKENLRRLAYHLSRQDLDWELIAIDDGSSDGTAAALAQAAKDLPATRLLRWPRNVGKGACLAHAFGAARGERVVFIDGDLAYPLESLDLIAAELERCDVAIACRRQNAAAAAPLHRRALSAAFRAIAGALLLRDIEDFQAGLKGFRRQAATLIAEKARCRGFAFDAEALAIARQQRLVIAQVPSRWDGSGPSTVWVMRDGLRMMGELARVWWRLRTGAYERPRARSRAASWASPTGWRAWGQLLREDPAILLVPAASLLTFAWFLPEVLHASLFVNDGVLHASIVRRMDAAWSRGGDIFDFWLRNVAAGHAFIRTSHFGLYLFTWLLHRFVLIGASVERCMAFAVLLTVCSLPFAFYKGGRLLGLTIAESAVAAALLPLVRDIRGYGVSLFNFTFTGHGIYNEAFALLSMPITLGLIHQALRGRRSIVTTAISYSITWMSHLFVGYMAFVWSLFDAAMAALSARKRWAEPVGRLVGLHALFGVFSAGLIVPILQDRLLQSRNLDEPPYRWVGHGAHRVLCDLFGGHYFDVGSSWPAVTVFAIIGVACCWWRFLRSASGDSGAFGLIAVQSCVWTTLDFGKTSLGPLVSWLPFSEDLHWHRFLVCMQLMLLYAAAIAVCQSYRWLCSWAPARRLQIGLGLAALFGPSLVSANRYYVMNYDNLRLSEQAWRQDTAFHRVLDFARTHDDSRFYVGNVNNFGRDMRLQAFTLYSVFTEFNLDAIGFLYHSLGHTSPLDYYTDPSDANDMNLLGVRYLAAPPGLRVPPRWKPVLTVDNAVLYDNGNQEGFFMAGTPATQRCADNDILYYSIRKWLTTSAQDNAIFPGVALVDECGGRDLLIDAVDVRGKPVSPGRVIAAGERPATASGHYWARVDMTNPGLIVFKMAYHPSWRILLNGQPAKTYMVVPGYTAVRVGPGRYHVDAEYIPSGLRKRLLLFGGLSALLALFARWVFGLTDPELVDPVEEPRHSARRAPGTGKSRRGPAPLALI